MIFISYCSANQDLAYKLVAYLEEGNISCFIAPRDIPVGQNYASVLTSALKRCDAAILVASSAINDSEHILNEIDILVNHKKTLIPFFIENFELNDEYRYYLGRAQRIIAYPDSVETYFPKILDSLRTTLNIELKLTQNGITLLRKIHQTLNNLDGSIESLQNYVNSLNAFTAIDCVYSPEIIDIYNRLITIIQACQEANRPFSKSESETLQKDANRLLKICAKLMEANKIS